MTSKLALGGASLLFVLATLTGCGDTPAPTSAAITAQPTDQSVLAGATATFNVVATDAAGYQWQSSVNGGATFAAVNGATSASYTTAVTTLPDSGTRYRVVVSGSSNSVTSSAVTLTVTVAPVAPVITINPGDRSVIAGADASFSVTATGTSLGYQWQRSTNGGANFAILAGATNATLTRTSVLLADDGHQFRVVVRNTAGEATSIPALLTVSAAPAIPAFTAHPASQSVIAPSSATFTVVATGTPTPTLQWQLSTNAGVSFADIGGATNSSYTTPATVGGDSGNQYRVVATNTQGETTSTVATLTVNLPAAPSFTAQPSNVAITEGQDAQFTVAVSGTPTPTLQWELSTDSGTTWSNINGATGTTFNVIGASLANSGRQFRAVATNGSGSVNSNAATLTVTANSTVIGPAGGTVNGYYGAQIIVPPGALASSVGIGLARDSTNSPAFALADVDAVGATYELTPHGTAFSLPVTLRVPFDPTQLPDDATPVLYKAETGGTFTALPTTVNGNFLEATITNFSWVIPGYAATKPRAVYVLQAAGVASYRINSTTGALTGPTSTALTGAAPTSVVAHPSRRFMYVSNSGSATVNAIAPNSVSTYRLNTLNGQIVGAATGSVSTGAPAGYQTTMPVIHPSGKFLYVMNFDVASINPLGFISLFTINGTTGALTLSASVTSGGDARPMGMAFNRLGTLAYVLYGGSSSTNPFATQVKWYSVNASTGELIGPSSGVAAGALGSAPWSIAIEPNGKFAYVAGLFTDAVLQYSINATSGALTNIGSTAVTIQSKLTSLAADSFGRFLFAGRQQPWNSKNLLAYQINATFGSLTLADSVLTACPGGGCVGPMAVVAEPQGKFVYALDVRQGLSAFRVDATTGALTSAGNLTNVFVPSTTGVGIPFTFAATGTSPVWQNNCTLGCALTGTVSGGGGGGGTNPTPPTSHHLTVTQGAFFGFVTSSPAGIDYGPPTINNPIPPSDFSAAFPVNSSVQLCTTPPPQPSQAYDVTWTGSCSGTGVCTSVVMTSDKQCHLEFTPVLGR